MGMEAGSFYNEQITKLINFNLNNHKKKKHVINKGPYRLYEFSNACFVILDFIQDLLKIYVDHITDDVLQFGG